MARRTGREALVAAPLAAGLMLAPGRAAAQDQRAWRPQIGAFVSYHFGPGEGRLGGGVDFRLLYARGLRDCSAPAELFGGFAARAAVVGTGQTRILAGGLIGRMSELSAIDATGLFGYRLFRDPGPHAQLGLGGALMIFNAEAAFAPFREGAVAVGARTLATPAGCSEVQIGRPLRCEGGFAALPASHIATSASVDAHRGAAASVWLARAAGEWASVPAFLELAEQLIVCDAPPSLVARACAAAGDEVRHTWVSAAIAASLARSTEVALAPPAPGAPRTPLPGAAGLRRLAVESWHDGCLGEGVAAAVARAESACSADDALGAALARIATDEAAHARLAWDVLRWALARDPDDVRPALAGVRDAVRCPPADPDGLSRFGCLGVTGAVGVAESVTTRARARLVALLS